MTDHPLRSRIESLWEGREMLSPSTTGEDRAVYFRYATLPPPTAAPAAAPPTTSDIAALANRRTN